MCQWNNPTDSGKHFFKHGFVSRKNKKPSIYNTWVAMRQRCRDVNDKQYNDYGGRGIYVCKEWDDFAVFYADLGPRPLGYQLDRIDNDGPYCKENCRWVDRKTQNNNRRSNRIHDIDGEKILHTKLLEIIGYNRDKFRKMEENKNRGLDEAYNIYRARQKSA